MSTGIADLYGRTMEVLVARLIKLRYPGVCTECGASLAPGTSALWEPSDKTVHCLRCPDHDRRFVESKPEEATPSAAEANAAEANAAGDSARREYERRRRRRARAIMQEYPRLGRLLLAVTREPDSTKAWARGATGEERVARRLERQLGDRGVVLNDRRLPGSRANIDHLVVAPSGVFAVDAKRYTGRIERRRVGPMFGGADHLFVAGRDRNELVEGVRAQAQRVREVLSAGQPLPVSAVLCFTGAEWPTFSRPFVIENVWIGWPRALAKSVVANALLDGEAIRSAAARLERAFPPA